MELNKFYTISRNITAIICWIDEKYNPYFNFCPVIGIETDTDDGKKCFYESVFFRIGSPAYDMDIMKEEDLCKNEFIVAYEEGTILNTHENEAKYFSKYKKIIEEKIEEQKEAREESCQN